jgi:transcriptional regulator with XRE-family HTH domain
MVPRRNQVNPLAAVIGQRLRDLRRARGLTLAQLAVDSDVASKGHLSDLENGRVLPTVGTLQALASALDVELLDLVISPEQSPRHRLVAHTVALPEPVMTRWLSEAESGNGSGNGKKNGNGSGKKNGNGSAKSGSATKAATRATTTGATNAPAKARRRPPRGQVVEKTKG